jgi:hypothetical protein
MNKIIDAGRRAAEFVRDYNFELAIGAIGLVGLGITANSVANGGIDELKTDAAIIVHANTNEWPSWTPDGVKPPSDMTGTDISRQMEHYGAVDPGQLQGVTPLQPDQIG